MKIDTGILRDLALRAGSAIMEVYDGEFEVEIKEDLSPLTAADRASHSVIEAGLKKCFPAIPILSEEGADIPYDEREHWRRFWLVDPLDGTKEFIVRNGEFTVNIALVEDGSPVLGVVYAPARQMLYWGARGGGAWLRAGDEEPRSIRVRKPDPDKGLTVVLSRSHPSPEVEEYLKTVKVAEVISVGSSLKLCAVAEGRADLYPRLGPTMEWDTGAGQAVVEAAGGKATTLDGRILEYNKAKLLNSYFIVSG